MTPDRVLHLPSVRVPRPLFCFLYIIHKSQFSLKQNPAKREKGEGPPDPASPRSLSAAASATENSVGPKQGASPVSTTTDCGLPTTAFRTRISRIHTAFIADQIIHRLLRLSQIKKEKKSVQIGEICG